MRRPAPPPQRLVGDPIPADCTPFRRSTVIIATLRPREREVLRAKALGASYDEVAASLGISVNTAKKHTKAVMHRAGAHSFDELLIALEWLRVPSEYPPERAQE